MHSQKRNLANPACIVQRLRFLAVFLALARRPYVGIGIIRRPF